MAKALLGLGLVAAGVGVAAIALAKKKEDAPPPYLGPGVVMVPDGQGGFVPARVGPRGIYPAMASPAVRRATRTAGACCAACAQGAPCGTTTDEEARMHSLLAATRAAGRVG